eukprot:53600-Eustigmatos_ZCMA.PRE.2
MEDMRDLALPIVPSNPALPLSRIFGGRSALRGTGACSGNHGRHQAESGEHFFILEGQVCMVITLVTDLSTTITVSRTPSSLSRHSFTAVHDCLQA